MGETFIAVVEEGDSPRNNLPKFDSTVTSHLGDVG